MWLMALNVLAVLAALFPWDLGQPADPLKPAPAGIHPEWYFMSQFQVLKILPGASGEAIGITLFTLGLALWSLIPLYDVRTAGGRRGRRATWFGLMALAILVGTTAWGYWSVSREKAAATAAARARAAAELKIKP